MFMKNAETAKKVHERRMLDKAPVEGGIRVILEVYGRQILYEITKTSVKWMQSCAKGTLVSKSILMIYALIY